MHRFSWKPEKIVRPPSGWVNLDAVSYEVKRAFYRDSYLNPNAKNRYYFEYLEPPPDFTKITRSGFSKNFIWYNSKKVIEHQKKNHLLEGYL